MVMGWILSEKREGQKYTYRKGEIDTHKIDRLDLDIIVFLQHPVHHIILHQLR